MKIDPWECVDGHYINHDTGEVITAEEFYSVDEKERV
jgi:hypothetical protein